MEPLPDGKSCRVVVPDDQLSLAIGKEGQNARLAAKLTGYKIDIKPASAPLEPIEAPEEELFVEEAERLRTYLAGGGSLFLVTNYGDYSTEAMPNLTALLAEYGMGARDGIVIENDRTAF